MKPLAVLLTFLLLAPGAGAQEVMRVDRATALHWQADFDHAPAETALPAAGAPRALDLLPFLDHVPAERNQGLCENCWVWAGTAMLEMALERQYGIRQRLSVQYLQSNWTRGSACCPADLKDFADFYAARKILVPWSNPNANFQDRRLECAGGPSLVPAGSIGVFPHFKIRSLSVAKVVTAGVGWAQAVENIKAALREGKAVCLSILWPERDLAGLDIHRAWNRDGEGDPWVPEHQEDRNCPLAATMHHDMVIVGYDATDPDPARHYWSVLNAWGATPRRPHGLIRIPMALNYDCRLQEGADHLDRFTFRVLHLELDETRAAPPSVSLRVSSAHPMAGEEVTFTAEAAGTMPLAYAWFKDGRPLAGAAGAALVLPVAGARDGGRYRVEVTNALGTAPSEEVALQVRGSQLLLNPGFEEGGAGWAFSPGHPAPLIHRPGSAHSGEWFLRLGDTRHAPGARKVVMASQRVAIPADFHPCLLSFWLRVVASQAREARDTLKVQVRDAGGGVLATLRTFTNLDAATHRAWVRERVDLAPFAGRTIDVVLVAELDEPAPHYAAFEVDDAGLGGIPGGRVRGYEGMAVLAGAWGSRRGGPHYLAGADLNGDGVVDDLDVKLFLDTF